MKPLIGIPCWQINPSHELRSSFALYQTYVNAVAAAGAAPVIIPLELDQEANQTLFARLDAIVLAGGDDVNPARYGETAHPKTEVPDDARDELEITLTQWAVAQRKPLMGICRGVQVMNVAMGGTLIQDIHDLVPEALEHSYPYDSPQLRGRATHEVYIDAGSRLAGVFGSCADVNSFHHQGPGQIANGFKVVGRAADGIVEAIESTDSALIFGVQWHPEDMYGTDANMLNLLKMFVDNLR
ncbi:MAG: gamma-glutamyl-gamma-aminobutyrate hydrolase family protein [Chloroflexota bacterium]